MSAIENQIKEMSDLQIESFIHDLYTCIDSARMERKALRKKQDASKDGKIINHVAAMRIALLSDIKRYGALLELLKNEKKRRGGETVVGSDPLPL